MYCDPGQVVFIQSDQADKNCPSTLILASSRSYLLGYIRGDMKSVYPELALCGSKNECVRTDTVFSSISEVCTMGMTLLKSFQTQKQYKECIFPRDPKCKKQVLVKILPKININDIYSLKYQRKFLKSFIFKHKKFTFWR